MPQKRVVIIGAGLGGMAAAITCAANGASVTIIEKNNRVGGKCNILETNGFKFDLGPSILLLPEVFRLLFHEAGKQFDNYVKLVQVPLQWRNFFEDGTVIDLYDNKQETINHLESKIHGSRKQFEAFYKYALHQYRIANSIFINNGADRISEIVTLKKLFSLLSMDLLRTMHQAVNHYFTNKHICNIFEYFIKYVGSSAYRAPGFMNLLSGAQFHSGLWYVDGGIYKLAIAMESLLKELGVSIHLNREVTRISTNDSYVNGIITADGEKISADAVISNMEVIPVYKKILPVRDNIKRLSHQLEPACSGIVIHLGLDKTYPQLGHHNFFYSHDQQKHFKAVFEEYQLPDDPTVYVVAPSRTDSSTVPPNCDIVKILPHIPHLRNDRLWSRKEYELFADKVLLKLERMGLTDLRKHVIVKDFWTPYDIEQRYYSNEGSIYGVVIDIWKNYAFKAPKQSKYYKNLFFAGGSVNPGGGMPMVVLSGLHAGRLVLKSFAAGM